MPFATTRPITPQRVPLPRRGKGSRLQAQHILDFRPGIDRVERDENGKAWVVDGQGLYAPVEVWGDRIPPDYAANLGRLSDQERWGLYRATALTPYLSDEGKAERLVVLRPLIKFRFDVVNALWCREGAMDMQATAALVVAHNQAMIDMAAMIAGLVGLEHAPQRRDYPGKKGPLATVKRQIHHPKVVWYHPESKHLCFELENEWVIGIASYCLRSPVRGVEVETLMELLAHLGVDLSEVGRMDS